MHAAVAVVRGGELARCEGHSGALNAASLVKEVIGHLAMELLDDLDQPVRGDITVRHVLSHTTGLPNWRPAGGSLEPVRPPGVRWGYSGEGFVLLQRLLEEQSGRSIDELASLYVFEPLVMRESRLDAPEPGYHGYRPLITTAADYGLFLAHVLGLNDERWQLQWRIDEEIGWGLAWGLELGSTLHVWQWGLNDDASAFVIGSPVTGDGVVVLTDTADGRDYYREVIQREIPGDHASLRLDHNPAWVELFI